MNPDKKVRRVQSLLYTSGVGIILFSIWSALRGIEGLFEVWNTLSREYGTGSNSVVRIALCLFVFLILMLVTFLYVYIGKTAMDVSLGKKKSHCYIFLSALLTIVSWSLYISQFTKGELFEIKTIIYILIDLTSNIILIEVIIFSLLLKKMR